MKLWYVGDGTDSPRPVNCPGDYPAQNEDEQVVLGKTHFYSEAQAWRGLLTDAKKWVEMLRLLDKSARNAREIARKELKRQETFSATIKKTLVMREKKLAEITKKRGVK